MFFYVKSNHFVLVIQNKEKCTTLYILRSFSQSWKCLPCITSLRQLITVEMSISYHMKCDNRITNMPQTVKILPEYEMATYKMQICVLVSNFSDLEGTLYVVRNVGQVPVREERGQRQKRPEALPGPRLHIRCCDEDADVDPCDLKGCSQHFEISATILNRTVASGWTLSHVLPLLLPS